MADRNPRPSKPMQDVGWFGRGMGVLTLTFVGMCIVKVGTIWF